MNKKYQIKNFMTHMPHTIGEEISLSKALEMMRVNHMRHLPVQSRAKVVGILSERDIRLALSVHPIAKDLVVGDVMTEEPYCVSPETALGAVAEEMAARKIGCAVVIDFQGRAIGIFTAIDAARVLSEMLELVSKPLPAAAG